MEKQQQDNQHLMEVRNLSVSFFTHAGEVQAVRNISYSVDSGKVMGIVGESGSGKSVSTHCMLGLVQSPGKIIGGDIVFDGKVVTELPEKDMLDIRGKDIAMIFQDPMTCLNPVFTVGSQIDETLRKHTKLNHEERRKRILELMKQVGISQGERRINQYPHELSGGMRQRVMIAMALSCNPKLLIADEPTTALDVTIQSQILELLLELKKKYNMAIVFVTHDLGVVSEICDEISVMYAGKILERGTREDIFYRPVHPYTKGLLASVPKVNLDEHQRLIPIDGNPADLIHPPKGCPFAPRCKHCMRICMNQMPPELTLEGDHKVSCWLPVYEAMKEAHHE